MIKLYCPSKKDYIYINPNHISYMYPAIGDLTMVKVIASRDIEFHVEETIEEILALINKK